VFFTTDGTICPAFCYIVLYLTIETNDADVVMAGRIVDDVCAGWDQDLFVHTPWFLASLVVKMPSSDPLRHKLKRVSASDFHGNFSASG
jgi:hypothetical protein